MSARQYIPYNRLAETMRHVFNISFSEGTIDNMLSAMADAAAPMYSQIQQRVAMADVVGGDETGIRIDGRKAWLFTFQSRLLTFIAVSFSRGSASIERLFSNGFPLSVYVTDCLAAQLKTPARLHQLCIVHLLRKLNNFVDALGCQWSAELKSLFKEAIETKRRSGPDDYLANNEKVRQMEDRLGILFRTGLDDKHPKLKAFIKRLNKNKGGNLYVPAPSPSATG